MMEKILDSRCGELEFKFLLAGDSAMNVHTPNGKGKYNCSGLCNYTSS